MCEYNMTELENIETYIENVRNRLPEEYKDSYSYLHTFICCFEGIKTCEWMDNYQYECPKYGKDKCDAYNMFCEAMENFDILGTMNYENDTRVIKYIEDEYLSILCRGEDIRCIIEYATIHGHKVEIKCVKESKNYPFGSYNHEGLFKINFTHRFEINEPFDWYDEKDYYGI